MSAYRRRGRLPKIEVVDLFCGTGGLSYGMKSHGLHIVSGFDIDPTCQYAFETNNGAKFYYQQLTRKMLRSEAILMRAKNTSLD